MNRAITKLASAAAALAAAAAITGTAVSADAGSAYRRPAACRSSGFLTDGRHSLDYYGHLQPGVTNQTLLYWADKCSRSGFWPFRLGLYMDRGNMRAPLPKHLRLRAFVFPWWPPPGR